MTMSELLNSPLVQSVACVVALVAVAGIPGWFLERADRRRHDREASRP